MYSEDARRERGLGAREDPFWLRLLLPQFNSIAVFLKAWSKRKRIARLISHKSAFMIPQLAFLTLRIFEILIEALSHIGGVIWLALYT